MKLYHAIICCPRDVRWVPWHVKHVDSRLSEKLVHRCVYFGQPLDGQPPQCSEAHHVVGALDTYENLPVKTYCLMEHALEKKDWDVLLKTDCNAEIKSVDWDKCGRYELTGFVSTLSGVRLCHAGRVFESALNESYGGTLPRRWVGGPAYAVSRRLAKLIVARGVWYARSHAYEDQMISLVAEEHGIPAEQAIVYGDADERVLAQ